MRTRHGIGWAGRRARCVRSTSKCAQLVMVAYAVSDAFWTFGAVRGKRVTRARCSRRRGYLLVASPLGRERTMNSEQRPVRPSPPRYFGERYLRNLEAAAQVVVQEWRAENPFLGLAIEQLERVVAPGPKEDA